MFFFMSDQQEYMWFHKWELLLGRTSPVNMIPRFPAVPLVSNVLVCLLPTMLYHLKCDKQGQHLLAICFVESIVILLYKSTHLCCSNMMRVHVHSGRHYFFACKTS